MNKLFLAIIFLFSGIPLLSQTIDITVSNLKADKTYLSALSGEKYSQIDSVVAKEGGRFVFNIKEQHKHPGIYRLSFGKSKPIDFVFDNEGVKITTDAGAVTDSMKIEASEASRIYYSYIKLNRQYKSKSELLQLVLARYPSDDPYYETTKMTAARLQKEYIGFVDNESRKQPKAFISRYLKSSQLPIVDFTLPLDKQLEFLKSHALDKVDFNDDDLVNSDVFSNKSIEYLTYYRNPQLPKELLEKEFMTAVDTILNKAKVNVLVYQHIAEYLIDGFRQFGFEKCISYILDNYVIKDDLCLEESRGSSIRRMIEQKKMLPVGGMVPDFNLPDSSGVTIALKKINAGRIVILFYSVECPHCKSMIPRLADFLKNRKDRDVEVLAVSLDTDRNAWLSFIRSNKLAWINVNDPLGWGGAAAADYYIYATPTMFLIDRDKKIISKPITIEELQKNF